MRGFYFVPMWSASLPIFLTGRLPLNRLPDKTKYDAQRRKCQDFQLMPDFARHTRSEVERCLGVLLHGTLTHLQRIVIGIRNTSGSSFVCVANAFLAKLGYF